jgi:TPR repeat protein
MVIFLFANDSTTPNALLIKANEFINNDKIENAIDIYDKLDNKSIVEASYNLGMIYGFGINNIDIDKKLAIHYLSKATQAGHKKAPYYLALILSEEEDINKNQIIKLILESAVLGFDKAELEFGKILLDKNNTKEAKKWIKKSRMQGNIEAEILWEESFF